jgi:Nucleotidyltransferase domain
VFVDQCPEVLDRLPAGYRDLFARLLDVVRGDQRVAQMWLTGSLGRGTADAGSDLDIILTVADPDFDAFSANWRTWLAQVTPTVLARGLPGMPGSWYCLTPGCERFDAVVERCGALSAGQTRTG